MPLKLLRNTIRTWREQGIIQLIIKIIRYLRKSIYRRYVKPHLQHLFYSFRYGRAAPWACDIRFIDPKEVDHIVTPRFRNLTKWGTYIRGGCWDKRKCEHHLMLTSKYHRGEEIEQRCLVPFEKYGLYRSSKRHFLEDIPWDQTEFYDWLYSHPHPDISKYQERRFERFGKLYEKIEIDGYQTQSSLDQTSILEKHLVPSDEILINIGRDGELLLDDGRHRLIIAKLLGVDKIPVRVLVRHEEWQQKRHRIATGTASTAEKERFSSHPDIQTLVDN